MTITLDKTAGANPVVGVYDVSGRLIDRLAQKASGSYEWNPGACHAGTYLVKVATQGSVSVGRVTLTE